MMDDISLKFHNLWNLRYRKQVLLNGTSIYKIVNFKLSETLNHPDMERGYIEPKSNEIIIENNVEYCFYDYRYANPIVIVDNETKNKIIENYKNTKSNIDKLLDAIKQKDIDSAGEDEENNIDASYIGDLLDNDTSRITLIDSKEYYANDNRMPYMAIQQIPKIPLLQQLNFTQILIILGILIIVIIGLVIGIGVFKIKLF